MTSIELINKRSAIALVALSIAPNKLRTDATLKLMGDVTASNSNLQFYCGCISGLNLL